MSKRCSCFAISTSRVCKNKFAFIIKDKKLCHLHARYEFNKYATLIQKLWVGYRARYLLKNIYTKLPDDLQRKVIFHVRQNYLIKKHHHDVICKILDKKLDRVWVISLIHELKTRNFIYQGRNLDKIAHIYYLYTKYFKIVPARQRRFLYECRFDFKYINSNFSTNINNFESNYVKMLLI